MNINKKITSGRAFKTTYKNVGYYRECRTTFFKELVKMLDPTHTYNTRNNNINLLEQPNCQNSLQEDRIQNIQNSYLKNPEFWEFRKNIVVGIICDRKYIIDGQHRINAFANIWRNYTESGIKPNLKWDEKNGDFVNIYYYQLKDKDELELLFCEINKDSIKNRNWIVNTPAFTKVVINDFLEKLKLQIVAEHTDNKNALKYGSPYFARKESTNGKQFTILEFRDMLMGFNFFENKSASNALNLIIEYSDDYYSINEKNYSNLKKYFKDDHNAIENKFFLGVKKCNFIDYIKYREKLTDIKYKLNFNHNHDQKKNSGRKKKDKISSQLREKIWIYHYGNIAIAKCLCCNEQEIRLGVNNWDAGHILSENNKGPTILENLIPICKNCNCKMGSTNWDSYVYNTYGIKYLVESNEKCKNELIVSQSIKNLLNRETESSANEMYIEPSINVNETQSTSSSWLPSFLASQ